VRPIRFGVSRSHGGPQLVEGARRFARLLQSRLGQKATCVVTRDYEHLQEGVVTAGIDLAWMPPLVHARSEGLLAAVVQRDGAVTYRAAILVSSVGNFRTLTDLRKARAAWTDRASASGYLFPRLHLLGASVTPASEAFLGSAASALAAVTGGEADFCSCFVSDAAGSDPARALDDVALSFPAAAWRLRVIGVTDAIPPDGLVLAPGIDGELQARLRDLLLQLHNDAEDAALLRDLFNAEKLVPVTQAVSRAIARLRRLAEKHL
jgi:phosphonate transport system substrate-binding protein